MATGGTLARYPSPLRYPGGKGKVSNFVKLLILENGLGGIDYVEPYAGGASVALSLLFEDYVDNIHINDLNRGIYAFWKLAVEDPDYLGSHIRAVRLDVDEWKRQRDIYSDSDADFDELGFATFYLNRTNRSGIIARGGVIGGLDQTGRWKMDARFDRSGLAARIGKIARFADRIKVSMLDAETLLTQHCKRQDPALFFLDPPYFVKGSQLYDNAYGPSDHLAICNLILGVSGPWIVSYDTAPEILEMYSSARSFPYTLDYSVSKFGQGAETVFFSDDLSIPAVQSPAGVSTAAVRSTQLYGQLAIDM